MGATGRTSGRTSRLATTAGVLGVLAVAGLAVAGGLAWGIVVEGQASVQGVITLEHAVFADIVCNQSASGPVFPVYYEVIFTVANLSGSLTTADFGLSVVTGANQSLAPDPSAPPPARSLPCGATAPTSWYAILEPAVANATGPTYPAADASGLWSNAVTAPTAVPLHGWLLIVTAGDFTGTGAHLTAFGLGSANVTLAGDTQFPGYVRP